MFEEYQNQSLPSRLREMRMACSLTQDVVSAAAGIDRSTLSYYETGEVYPSMSKLCLLATLFGVTMDDLLGNSAADADNLLLYQRSMEDDESFSEEAVEPISFTEFSTFQMHDDGCEEQLGLLPGSMSALKTEEQLLVLYYRQLLDKDKSQLLNDLSETVEELHKALLDPNDHDIILNEELMKEIEKDNE